MNFWCSFDDLWSWFVFDYVHVGINHGEVLFPEYWTWRMKKRMKKVEERMLENTKKLSHAVNHHPVRTLNGPGRCCLILCAHPLDMCPPLLVLRGAASSHAHTLRTCAHLKWCRADLSSAKQNSFWDFLAQFSVLFSPFLLIFVDELGRSLEFLVILSFFMMISFISSSISSSLSMFG